MSPLVLVDAPVSGGAPDPVITSSVVLLVVPLDVAVDVVVVVGGCVATVTSDETTEEDVTRAMVGLVAPSVAVVDGTVVSDSQGFDWQRY